MKKFLSSVIYAIPMLCIFAVCLYIVLPKEEVVACPVVERKEVVVQEVKEEKATYVPGKCNIVAVVEEKANPKYVIDVTEEEIDLMARVVMSESSILPQDGKQAVAQTIVNRVLSDEFPNTVTEVVYQPYQYSTADNGEPTAECYKAVEYALTNLAFPKDLYYYRLDYPHSFGYFYCQIGNTYFSTGEFDYNE